jgi:hypothetical protein
VLNEGTLVLEGVTLAQVVELVVEVLVDLAGGAVLDQQTTEDTETAHPHNLAVGNCQPQFHLSSNISTPCNPSPLATRIPSIFQLPSSPG